MGNEMGNLQSRKTVFVVGENYVNDHDCFYTVTQARKLDPSKHRFCIGLGLAVEQLSLSDLKHFGLSTPMELAAQTNKQKLKNVLLRQPTTNGALDVYDFTMNEAGELLQDHKTRMHVPGMVAIEAGRQATINSFHIRNPQYRGLVGQVMYGLEVHFLKYFFPLPTRLHVFYSETTSKPKRLSWEFNTSVEVIQNDVITCRLKYSFAAKDKMKLARVEEQMLEELVDTMGGEDV